MQPSVLFVARQDSSPPPVTRKVYNVKLSYIYISLCCSIHHTQIYVLQYIGMCFNFTFHPAYVQSWIEKLLSRSLPVTDDLVVHLSDLARARLALDTIALALLQCEQDWEDDHASRYDLLTTRQRTIEQQRPPLFELLHSTHATLKAACPHPGYGPPPSLFDHSFTPSYFHHPYLCVLCLSPPSE